MGFKRDIHYALGVLKNYSELETCNDYAIKVKFRKPATAPEHCWPVTFNCGSVQIIPVKDSEYYKIWFTIPLKESDEDLNKIISERSNKDFWGVFDMLDIHFGKTAGFSNQNYIYTMTKTGGNKKWLTNTANAKNASTLTLPKKTATNGTANGTKPMRIRIKFTNVP